VQLTAAHFLQARHELCEPCVRGKSVQASHSKASACNRVPERICTDVAGPYIEAAAPDVGARYVVTAIDQFSEVLQGGVHQAQVGRSAVRA
jgi:hypothetical protein